MVSPKNNDGTSSDLQKDRSGFRFTIRWLLLVVTAFCIVVFVTRDFWVFVGALIVVSLLGLGLFVIGKDEHGGGIGPQFIRCVAGGLAGVINGVAVAVVIIILAKYWFSLECGTMTTLKLGGLIGALAGIAFPRVFGRLYVPLP